jgi:hypothetical protein
VSSGQAAGASADTTDAELHRREWIEERAGILQADGGMDAAAAGTLAAQMWIDYRADRDTPADD